MTETSLSALPKTNPVNLPRNDFQQTRRRGVKFVNWSPRHNDSIRVRTGNSHPAATLARSSQSLQAFGVSICEPKSPISGDMEPERKLLVALVAVLLGLGTLMVHSASGTSRPSQLDEIYLSKHLVYAATGVLAATVASLLPSRTWRRIAPPFFALTIVLLVLVLIPGVGSTVKGARRWFRVAGLSFQPSELAKLAIPLMVALLAQRGREVWHDWRRGVIPVVYPLLIAVPLIMKQPDLGTSLFVLLGGGLTLFLSGWPLRYFLMGGAVAVPGVIVVVLNKSYQLRRVHDFLATWNDWTQAPWHLKQSLVTLAAGGTWGTGIGRGQQKLSFLPEANTDFIFAVIGEELGLVGALAVLVIWIGLYACGLRLINRLTAGSFESIVAFTLLTQVLMQAAINVAVVTALVPPKGIPHPLLSYGGTNLVVSLLAIGIVLSLTRVAPASSTAEHPRTDLDLVPARDLALDRAAA